MSLSSIMNSIMGSSSNEVSFNTNDGKQVKFMINDQSGQVKLDYYVDDHMELPGLKSLTGEDRTIELSAVSNEGKIEEKTESVKLKSVSYEDVKRVLALGRKVGLVPRLVRIADLHRYLLQDQYLAAELTAQKLLVEQMVTVEQGEDMMDEEDILFFRLIARLRLHRIEVSLNEYAAREDTRAGEIFRALDQNDDKRVTCGEVQKWLYRHGIPLTESDVRELTYSKAPSQSSSGTDFDESMLTLRVGLEIKLMEMARLAASNSTSGNEARVVSPMHSSMEAQLQEPEYFADAGDIEMQRNSDGTGDVDRPSVKEMKARLQARKDDAKVRQVGSDVVRTRAPKEKVKKLIHGKPGVNSKRLTKPEKPDDDSFI